MAENHCVTYPSPTPKRRRARGGYVAPPLALLAKLGDRGRPRMAVWVETSQPPPQRSAKFSDRDLDVARLAWAISVDEEVATIKEYIVKPRAPPGQNERETGATEETPNSGIQMKTALEEFMTDVLDMVRQGGRLWGHHIAWHGFVIEHHLDQLAMHALQKTWGHVLREGISLCDSVIGGYVKESCGETCTQRPSDNTLSLQGLILRVLPDYAASRQYAPTPIENAAIILRLVHSLYELVLPPCQRRGGLHMYTRVFPTGMRDNGEWTEQCAVCSRMRS